MSGDLTFIDVLQLAESNIKLANVFKYFEEEVPLLHVVKYSEAETRHMREKLDKLVAKCKKGKKFIMKSLRGKLSELLPELSMEEDILYNIIGHMNLLEQDANVNWKFAETTEEERVILASLSRKFREVYRDRYGMLLLENHLRSIKDEIDSKILLVKFVREFCGQN